MRPIIGHTEILEQLERMVLLSARPQSFLFAGPRHVGKRTVAEYFAERLINGAQQHHTTHAFWEECMVVEPEVNSTAAATREKQISIEAIRELQQFLSRSSERQRVAIIDRAEKLGGSAGNALLKILEEPPAQSTLIVLTSEPETLLPTLRSRLLPLVFRPVDAATLKQALPQSEELPQFFTDLGLPGLVIEALESNDTFTLKKDLLRSLFQLSKLPWRERLALSETLAKDEGLVRDVLQIWAIGLTFQARTKSLQEATVRYQLLEKILQTVRALSQSDSGTRGMLEKLFLSFP